MEEPLISVIIPAYNSSKFIRKSIESVLNQTYKSFEIIVINDGSTDNTLEVLTDISNSIDNVKIYTIENGGASKARNKGLLYATGDLIYFLDSDDTLNSRAFEILVRALEENNADIVVSTRYYKINEGDTKKQITKLIPNKMKIEDPVKYSIECLIGLGRGWRTHGSIFKRELITQNNIKYYEGIIAEDFLFNMDYLKVCKKIAFIDYPSENYLVRKNSVSRSFNPNLYSIYLEFDKFVSLYLSQYAINNSDLYRESFTGRNFINYIISIIMGNKLSYKEKCNYLMEIIENKEIAKVYKSKDYLEVKYPSLLKVMIFKCFRSIMHHRKYNVLYCFAKISSYLGK